MNPDVKSILIPVISGIVTGVVGYFLGRPKSKAETKEIETNIASKEIANLREIIDSWKEFSDEQEKRIAKQNEKIKVQDNKIKELQKSVEKLTRQIKEQCQVCEHETNKQKK